MTERAKLAQDFHDQGYNCAQAVACAYCDLVGLDKETAYKMSEGFGFGMGCMEMCGALSGAFMLAGMKNSAGADKPGTTKGQTYKVNENAQGEVRTEERRVSVPRPQGRSRRQCTALLPGLH